MERSRRLGRTGDFVQSVVAAVWSADSSLITALSFGERVASVASRVRGSFVMLASLIAPRHGSSPQTPPAPAGESAGRGYPLLGTGLGQRLWGLCCGLNSSAPLRG